MPRRSSSRLIPRSLLALTALLVLAGACSDDDGDGTATTSTDTTSTDTTSTDTTSTDTTAADPDAGDVPAPSPLVLRGDGLGAVDLGADPDDAVAAVSESLGDPTADTGWESSFSSYGTCPGEEIRGVEWDHLVLLFTDGETAHGDGPHFFAWRITGAPPALGTQSGFGYLATVADAEELHGDGVRLNPAEDPFPAFLEIEVDGGTVRAFLDEEERVTNLEAGAPCGE